MIYSLPPDQFRETYPEIKRFFENFVSRARGSIKPGFLELEIMTGLRQCYVASVDGEIVACALSRVAPNGKITVDFCAGEGRARWQERMIATFEEWADAKGVDLEIVCRPGWVRALAMAGRGYRETHRVMERRHGR